MEQVRANVRHVQHSMRWLTVAVLALFVTVGVLGVLAFRSAHQNHDALCTFRADLQTRIQASKDFIADHPEGFAGISTAVIQQQIENQQRTVDSLDGLHCE